MFIHVGDRIVISDRDVVAILNCDTIRKSPDVNAQLMEKITDTDKTIAVCTKSIVTTKVSSFTVIKRYGKLIDVVWSKKV